MFPSPSNGTTYLYSSRLGTGLQFQTQNGTPFRLASLDLAEGSRSISLISVTFTGTKADNSEVSATFTLDGVMDGQGPLLDFQTVHFGPEFSDLVKVTTSARNVVLDQIVVTVDGAPEPEDDTYHLPEDQWEHLPVLANDAGADLTLASVTPGASGTTTVSNGTLSYHPGPDFDGNDTFTYTTRTPSGQTTPARVRLVNRPPVAAPDTASIQPGARIFLPLLANDTDADQDALTLGEISGLPPRGVTVTREGDGVFFETPFAYDGLISFSYTVSDGHGGTAVGQVSVQVTSLQSVAMLSQVQDEAVPHRGVDPRIGAAAVWRGFGPPMINEAGQIAFLGRWRSSQPRNVQVGTGIFVDDELIVKVGDAVPGSGQGGLPADATFASFKDPLINAHGHVACIATIQGTGVTASNKTIIITNSFAGTLKVIAREGIPTSGVPDQMVFREFKSITFHATSAAIYPEQSWSLVAFTASLARGRGSPAVTEANDSGLWCLASGESSVIEIVRKGDRIGRETVASIVALEPLSGSPGHGRGVSEAFRGLIRLTLTRGPRTRQAQAMVFFSSYSSPKWLVQAATGEPLHSQRLRAARWGTMNLPSTVNHIRYRSVLGSIQGVPGWKQGIFQSVDDGESWEPVAGVGRPVPNEPLLSVFTRLQDPVQASTGNRLAFLGTARARRIPPLLRTGVWVSEQQELPFAVALEALEAPGCSGAKWKSFTSLALPGGPTGPLFTATLERGAGNQPGPGGVTSADDFALFGTDTQGQVDLLLREGQSLDGKRIKTFAVLEAVPGSAGSARAYNSKGQVVAHATFTDGSSGIVRMQVR